MIRVLVILVGLGLASPAHAQDSPTIKHTVKRGDSLELLAAEYYGDRRHAVFIMVANELTHPRPLKPGETLRVPMNRKVTTKAGDTFESLAKQYMGDERRAKFLAEFNNLPAKASIAIGQTIEIPFHVVHRAAGAETIVNIAAAYFGDTSKGDLLKGYNFLNKDELSRGEGIIIPINHVRVQSSKLPALDAESAARVQKRQDMQRKALAEMPRVRSAWQAGDFSGVKRELTKLETEYLDTDLAVQVGVLLGSAYVAFGDADSALVTFRKTLERSPDHQLSAYDHSPKVRQVWIQAGGGIARP